MDIALLGAVLAACVLCLWAALWRWKERKAPKASRQKPTTLRRSSLPRRRKHLCSQPASL